MAIAKVIEVIAEGNTVEAAREAIVVGASKIVRNIKSVCADSFQGVVEDGVVTKYRVNCKVTFIVD